MGTSRFWCCSLPFAISAFNASGQDVSQIDTARANKFYDHHFSIEAEEAYDSDVLYNDLVLGLYRGGTISRDVRQHSMDAINGDGRAGNELGVRASYSWGDSLLGHPQWRPMISASYHSAMGMRFTEDAYHLTFFGNSDLVDQTAQLGTSRYEQVIYRSIGFAIQDKRTGTSVGLNLVSGQSLNAADIRKADLFTATDGRYLDLQLDGDYWASDTSGSSFDRSNGIGGSIDLQWNKTFRIFGGPAVLGIGIRDLGAVAWNKNSVRVSSDTTIHFEGIHVDDILDLDGVLLDRTAFQDSLGLGYESGTFLRMLPAQFKASLAFGHVLSQSVPDELRAYELTVDQHYLPGYIPHAALDRNFKLARSLNAGLGVGYGGFGGLRVAVGVEAQLGLLHLELQTTNVIGLVSDQAMGKSVLFGITADW